MVDVRHHRDGTITIILTSGGKKLAIRYSFDALRITRPKQWDKKWRVILFDIPERQKKLRDALRYHFKRLGLHEFQKSVFIHSYDCRDEVDFIVEYYHARKYVRFIVAEMLDNELHLKRTFEL